MPDLPLHVYCADIGSMRAGKKGDTNNFGWAGASTYTNNPNLPSSGCNPQSLADAVATDLTRNSKVALGFECPLWIEIRTLPEALTKARDGEGNRPWSFGSGSNSLVTGLAQVTWILQTVRKKCQHPTQAYLNWESFSQAENGLFLWEAFISNKNKNPDDAHPNPHIRDAKTAVGTFLSFPDCPKSSLPLPTTSRTLSFIGTALLWAGWSCDEKILHEPCLVIKPQTTVGVEK